MTHLADQCDRRAEHNRADRSADIREIRSIAAVEPRSEAVSAGDAGKQNEEACRPCDGCPVGGNEGEECRGDQKAAENAYNGRNVDGFGRGWQRRADRVNGRCRDHAVRLPPRKIGIETLAVGAFEHRVASGFRRQTCGFPSKNTTGKMRVVRQPRGLRRL